VVHVAPPGEQGRRRQEGEEGQCEGVARYVSSTCDACLVVCICCSQAVKFR
jgi:hypothetical protein